MASSVHAPSAASGTRARAATCASDAPSRPRRATSVTGRERGLRESLNSFSYFLPAPAVRALPDVLHLFSHVSSGRLLSFPLAAMTVRDVLELPDTEVPEAGLDQLAQVLNEEETAPGMNALEKAPILGDKLLKVVEGEHDSTGAGSVQELQVD